MNSYGHMKVVHQQYKNRKPNPMAVIEARQQESSRTADEKDLRKLSVWQRKCLAPTLFPCEGSATWRVVGLERRAIHPVFPDLWNRLENGGSVALTMLQMRLLGTVQFLMKANGYFVDEAGKEFYFFIKLDVPKKQAPDCGDGLPSGIRTVISEFAWMMSDFGTSPEVAGLFAKPALYRIVSYCCYTRAQYFWLWLFPFRLDHLKFISLCQSFELPFLARRVWTKKMLDPPDRFDIFSVMDSVRHQKCFEFKMNSQVLGWDREWNHERLRWEYDISHLLCCPVENCVFIAPFPLLLNHMNVVHHTLKEGDGWECCPHCAYPIKPRIGHISEDPYFIEHLCKCPLYRSLALYFNRNDDCVPEWEREIRRKPEWALIKAAVVNCSDGSAYAVGVRNVRHGTLDVEFL